MWIDQMFSVEMRDELRDRVLEVAREDPRIVAGAEVGSLVLGGGDRWSDVDLTFAVDETADLASVVEGVTQVVEEEGGIALFDLDVGPTVYRVFMLEGCLQIDLSFTPAPAFRPTSPRFRLLFGQAGEMKVPDTPDAGELLGWAVVYAAHARRCIERGLHWQAEHCISAMRQNALSFACLWRELPAGHGRGVDQLPDEVHARFASTLVRGLETEALKEALKTCVDALSAECAEEGSDRSRAIRDRLLDTTLDI